jgi:hypothetical protein
MKRLMTFIAATSAIAGGVAAVPTAALAQAGQTTITIYGNDPCPRENICIRAPESQRYRLPQSQNPQGTRQQRQSWAQKSKQIMSVGNSGAMTCSPVGPGGYTGCLNQEINQARQDSKEQQQQNAPPQ